MAFYPRKKRMGRKRPMTRRNKTAKVSKPLRRAVKQVMKTQVETKTINCPLTPGGGTNSAFVPYGALSGIQYLCQDVFRCSQGTNDSTAIGALNRIGDKVQAIGFLMDYYFSIPNFYPVAATSFFLPYVKKILKILVRHCKSFSETLYTINKSVLIRLLRIRLLFFEYHCSQ